MPKIDDSADQGTETCFLYYPESGEVEGFIDEDARQDEIRSWNGRIVSYIPIESLDDLQYLDGVVKITR